MIAVRLEQPGDAHAIPAIVAAAFGREDKTGIMAALRARGHVALSLVAVEPDRMVGHVAFSLVAIASPAGAWRAVALGPLAVALGPVAPPHQRRGVGTRLVEAGLEALHWRLTQSS